MHKLKDEQNGSCNNPKCENKSIATHSIRLDESLASKTKRFPTWIGTICFVNKKKKQKIKHRVKIVFVYFKQVLS